MSKQVTINRIVKSTKVEGFGIRYCIWFQGCSIRCNGCSNKDMWNIKEGNNINIDDLVQDILNQHDKIEGITILGGEPFDQEEELATICKEVSKFGYSIILFTGYKYKDLINKESKNIDKIMKYTDLLIDGPFELENKDYSRPWIGSSNQNYIFLSNRYNIEQLNGIKNKFEINIDTRGRILINGMGDYEKLKKSLLNIGGEK